MFGRKALTLYEGMGSLLENDFINVKKGKPVFAYDYLGLKTCTATGEAALPNIWQSGGQDLREGELLDREALPTVDAAGDLAVEVPDPGLVIAEVNGN